MRTRSKYFTLVAAAAFASGCAAEDPLPSQHDPAAHVAGAPRGVLAGYERGRVWGWAHIVGDASPVEVRIDVDGETVAIVTADQLREDLLDKGLHPTGEAGFSADIGELPLDAEVDATIVSSDTPLANGPCVVQGEHGVSSCTEGMSRGVIGGYRDGRVWGWAHVVGDAEPVWVRIEVDGETVATVLANQPREDLLAKRLHPTGAAGFSAEVGEVDPDAAITARVVGRSRVLIGSPVRR
jgi:S1-C subfamily serine protease